VRLIPVDPGNETHLKVLYDLLAERTPEQSISHKGLPTWEEHCAFVRSMGVAHPVSDQWGYKVWRLIEEEGAGFVGAVYLTCRNEIGIFVFKAYQRKGYGSRAVRSLMDEHRGRLLANINPANEASAAMFSKLGFRLVQHTYALEPEA
jgi:RimJ/RimL family protein N-acetyltransferase